MLHHSQQMNAFDSRQTDCFVAAVQSGTIRSAAEKLGLEPSTVSRNISALEAATSSTLLERSRSGVKVTEAGAMLLDYIHKQATELEVLQSQFDALANMKRGNILIAVGEGFVGDLFNQAMCDFNKDYPDITFGLSVGSTDHVVDQIATEQSHLGLAYSVAADPRLRVEMSAYQPLVSLVRKAGQFDTDAPFDLQSLAKLPCAVPPKSFGIGAMIAASEAKSGLRMNALVETGSIAAIKAFVQNDMGYTILPRFVVEAEIASGAFVAYPIAAEAFSGGVASMIRKEGRRLPQAAQLFMRQLGKMDAFG
jgi:DNA-binding transcriptional LysR family regulator